MHVRADQPISRLQNAVGRISSPGIVLEIELAKDVGGPAEKQRAEIQGIGPGAVVPVNPHIERTSNGHVRNTELPAEWSFFNRCFRKLDPGLNIFHHHADWNFFAHSLQDSVEHPGVHFFRFKTE